MSQIRNPFESRPRSVALLGLGPSLHEWITENSRKKNLYHVDEVWGINTAHRTIACDTIWSMDDLAHVDSEYPDWSNQLKSTKLPIVTCRAHPDFANSFEYPINEVEECIKDEYFTTTVAYAIAYAIYIQVDKLYIFGCDFHYPNAAIVESGQACVSYLLGIAKERGVHFMIPATSTLMDANIVRLDEKSNQPIRLKYGYDYNPQYAKRQLEKGRQVDPLHQALANQAYRPQQPDDPACMKAIQDAIKNGQMEPKIEVQ